MWRCVIIIMAHRDFFRRIVTFLIIAPYKYSYLLTYLLTYKPVKDGYRVIVMSNLFV